MEKQQRRVSTTPALSDLSAFCFIPLSVSLVTPPQPDGRSAATSSERGGVISSVRAWYCGRSGSHISRCHAEALS